MDYALLKTHLINNVLYNFVTMHSNTGIKVCYGWKILHIVALEIGTYLHWRIKMLVNDGVFETLDFIDFY